MSVQTLFKFGSNQEFRDYVKNHPEALDSVSPGGAASRLGVTRQQVYNLIHRGKVRAWLVYDCEIDGCYDVPGNSASYVYISYPDLEAYRKAPKAKGGRPKKEAA